MKEFIYKLHVDFLKSLLFYNILNRAKCGQYVKSENNDKITAALFFLVFYTFLAALILAIFMLHKKKSFAAVLLYMSPRVGSCPFIHLSIFRQSLQLLLQFCTIFLKLYHLT